MINRTQISEIIRRKLATNIQNFSKRSPKIGQLGKKTQGHCV